MEILTRNKQSLLRETERGKIKRDKGKKEKRVQQLLGEIMVTDLLSLSPQATDH